HWMRNPVAQASRLCGTGETPVLRTEPLRPAGPGVEGSRLDVAQLLLPLQAHRLVHPGRLHGGRDQPYLDRRQLADLHGVAVVRVRLQLLLYFLSQFGQVAGVRPLQVKGVARWTIEDR